MFHRPEQLKTLKYQMTMNNHFVGASIRIIYLFMLKEGENLVLFYGQTLDIQSLKINFEIFFNINSMNFFLIHFFSHFSF